MSATVTTAEAFSTRIRAGEVEPIGRETELEFLEDLLADAEEAMGGLALISGSAGMGKSTLARWIARRAKQLGFQVGQGTIEPGPRARLPWPWPRILRSLRGEECTRLRRELISERLGADGTDGFLGGSGLQAGRLATRLVDAISSAARDAPLLLVFDDAHSFDVASVETLRLVAEAVDHLPVLLLAVGRHDVTATEEATQDPMRALASEAGPRALTLQPLAARAIGEIVGEALTKRLGGDTAVATLTARNPFLATELRRTGARDAAELLRGESLESALATLVLKRLEGVEASVRDAVEAIALEPGRLDLGLLAEVLDVGVDDIETRVLDPALTGLVALTKEGTALSVELSHDLLRSALVQAIEPGRRRELHMRFVRVLTDRSARNVPVVTSSVAHHACSAAPTVAGEEAASWAIRAAAEANDSEAWSSARGWVDAGMQALAIDESAVERSVRASLLVEGFAADSVDPDRARSRLAECARLGAQLEPSEHLDLIVRLIDAERGRTSDPRVLGELITLVDETARRFSGDDQECVGLVSRKAGILHRIADRAARHECEELSSRALEGSAAPGVAPTHRINALATYLLCNVFGSSPAERLVLADELERLRDGVGDDGVLLIASTARVVDGLAACAPEAADRAIDQLSRQVALTTNHPVSWYPFHLRAMRAAMKGDVSGARRFLEAGIENAEGNYFDVSSSAVVLLAHLCEIAGISVEAVPPLPALVLPGLPEAQGGLRRSVTGDGNEEHPLLRPWSAAVEEAAIRASDKDGAADLLEDMRVPVGAAPDLVHHWRAGYAKLLSRTLEQPEAARDLIEEMARQDFAEIPRDAQWLSSICLLAETCFDLRHADVAAQLLRCLAPWSDRVAVTAMGLVCGGAVAGYAAPLAWLAGVQGEFERLSDDAIRINDEIGAIYFATRVRLERAIILCETEGDHREEAAKFARAGLQTVERAGLAGLQPLVERLREFDTEILAPGERSRETDEAVPTPAVVESGVFRRNGDVWQVRWADEEVQLPHQRGFDCIRALLMRPQEDVHCRELMGSEAAATHRASTTESLRLGEMTVADDDGLEVVDSQALDAYRARIADARAELDEAEEHNDVGRAESLRQEIEAIVEMVGASTGLGGRRRKTGSDAERARTAVRKRIKAALDRLRRDLPALHAHLAAHLQTGTICSYGPERVPNWETAGPAAAGS